MEEAAEMAERKRITTKRRVGGQGKVEVRGHRQGRCTWRRDKRRGAADGEVIVVSERNRVELMRRVSSGVMEKRHITTAQPEVEEVEGGGGKAEERRLMD